MGTEFLRVQEGMLGRRRREAWTWRRFGIAYCARKDNETQNEARILRQCLGRNRGWSDRCGEFDDEIASVDCPPAEDRELADIRVSLKIGTAA